jgi:hypothetical protein
MLVASVRSVGMWRKKSMLFIEPARDDGAILQSEPRSCLIDRLTGLADLRACR